MVVLASAYRTPVPLAIAVPFGVTGYLMWYQGTGRLEQRMRQRVARGGRGRNRNANRRAPGGVGTRAEARGRSTEPSGPSREEAYRILDLDPDADEGRVKRAYREKVKASHPDRGGDEAEFRRVNDAYERLTD
jgi:DnaJ-class molecular chaperone